MEQACLYLTEKRYPDDCTATRKRQKAKKFAVIDGELFYRPKVDQVRFYIRNSTRILLSSHEIVGEVHPREKGATKDCAGIPPISGHMGIKRTVARVKERFAWKGVVQDVQQIVS